MDYGLVLLVLALFVLVFLVGGVVFVDVGVGLGIRTVREWWDVVCLGCPFWRLGGVQYSRCHGVVRGVRFF